jgi:hypothetical protein
MLLRTLCFTAFIAITGLTRVAAADDKPAPTATPGVEAPPHLRRWQGRFWLAEGPALVDSYGKEFFGNDFSAGGTFEFGSQMRGLVGAELNWLGSGETSGESVVGPIHRFALMTRVGFYLVPKTLYFAAKGGISQIGSNYSQNGLYWFVGGFELGGYFATIFRNFDVGAALSYSYSPSVDVGAYFDGSGEVHGPVVSSASVFSLQLMVSFLVPPR